MTALWTRSAAFAVWLLGATAPAAAQVVQPWATAEELPARIFDSRDGVPRSVLQKVKALPDQSLWLGTDVGVFQYDGRRWRPYALPDSIGEPSAKDFALTADGSRWFALRRGVLRDSAGVQRWYPMPDAPVWNLVISRALDPAGALVASLRRGLQRWNGTAFVPFQLPPGFPDANLVVAQTTRDSAASFWVGSLSGGVARFRRGAWQRFTERDGLPADARIEHFAVGPAGDPYEVLATATNAVYGFDGRRWIVLRRGGSQYLRSARLVRAGRFETWVSLSNGDLLTDGGIGTWRHLRPAGRIPSGAPQALSVIREGDGSFLVFVGYRSGELARFRVGRAQALSAPSSGRGRTVRALLDDPREGLVFSVYGGGIYRSRDGVRVTQMNDSLDAWRIVRASRATGGDLWAVTNHYGLWRLNGDHWTPERDGPPGRAALSQLVEGPGPDGRLTLVVGAAFGGLWYRSDAGWREWAGGPFTGSVRSMVADSAAGRRTLWTIDATTLAHWDGRQWTVVASATATGSEFVSLALDRRGDRPRLWVAMMDGRLAHLDLDAAAPALQPLALPDWVEARPRYAWSLAAVGDGTLLLGTSNGLLHVQPDVARRVARVLAAYADEDGLPSADVPVLAAASAPGQIWAGTLSGPALVKLGVERRPISLADLDVRLVKLHAPAGTVADGATLRWGEHDLRLDLALRTDYREDEVRYRFRLNGPLQLVQGWTDEPGAVLRGLPSGAYTLEVWAVRGFGDPVGPVRRTFAVAAPAWRAPGTLLTYLLGAGLLLWGLIRWRTGALRRRQRELEANERRLAESERRFRVLFERSVEAQLLADGAQIVAANPAACALLGADGAPATLVGARLTDVLPAAATLPPASADSVETAARAVDGSVRPVQVRRTEVPVEGGVLDHLELRDLREPHRLAAERELLEQQLRESQRIEALGTLAGGVAHDFNNLLTVIRNGAEMAREAEARGERDPESFEAILTASARARDLVRQILAFSRRLPTRRDRLVADDLLRDLQPMLRASMPPTIRVVVEPRALGAVIVGDQTQLTQVLVNLATNAEYAMRGRPDAVLTMRSDLVTLPDDVAPRHRPLPDGRYVRLRVSDTGTGIREEIRQRIFEPFFTTKPVGEGTGLGLSVLHGIVVAHDGSVTVESAPGEGTTFELLLPLADQLDSAAAPVVAPASGNASARILLVDDEQLVLKATDRVLRRHGYAVTALAHGLEAQRLLEGETPFDLLITDLNMPDVSGVVLARLAQQRRPPLPVILLTGFSGEVAAQLTEVAVVEVIEKPYEVEVLLAAVGRTLAAAARG